ncbi:surfeit locus protein 2-like [Argonauta hians]
MAINMSNTTNISADVQKILSENSHLEYISDTGKIKCNLSGHEMSSEADVVNSYLQGKKHKRLKALHDYDHEKYKPHLIESTKKFPKNQLLCLLTCKYINNSHTSIQKHVSGHKFLKAFKRWEECEKEGTKFVYPKKLKPNCPDKFESLKKKGKKKKKKKGNAREEREEEEEEEDDESDNDSLSDLYPKEDFPEEEEEEEEVTYKKSKNGRSGKKSKDVTRKRKRTPNFEEKEEKDDDDDEDVKDSGGRGSGSSQAKDDGLVIRNIPNSEITFRKKKRHRKKKAAQT